VIDPLTAFGPKRMDYERLIMLSGITVRLPGNALSQN
jgi:transcriptional regulator of heat shock response